MIALWLTLVFTCIVFGYAGYLFATKTGRDPVRWTILGALFNVLILGVFVVVGGRSQKAKQYIR